MKFMNRDYVLILNSLCMQLSFNQQPYGLMYFSLIYQHLLCIYNN